MYFNQLICCGNLAADPILFDHQGNPYAKFTIALNKPSTNKPVYISCIAWGPVGVAIAEHCVKGQEIHVCGEIDIHSYTDKYEVTRQDTSLKVREFSAGKSPVQTERTIRVPRPSFIDLDSEDSQNRG